MLSDEENKMLEIFKKEVEKEQNEYEQVNEYTKFYYNNHKFILSLIEKQSKEIEELNRENTRQHELIGNIHQKWEDKIKAKIEELDDINSEFSQRVIKGKEVYLTEMVQNILKELLEKE